jgi:hypothetical protein
MTLSILLTVAWDSKVAATPPRLEILKVRSHRFSWKNAGTIGIPKSPWNVVAQRWIDGDDGGATEDAEVIVPSGDEWMFQTLHGVTAVNANYDAVAGLVLADEYVGIVDALKEMAAQHPEATWFVRSWTVETAPSE